MSPSHDRIRLLALCSLVLLAGCDRGGGITIVPEFDLSYSFETSFDEWYGNGVDLQNPLVTWSVDRSTAAASDGATSVAISVDNTNGTAKVWIERAFEVQPERAYDIEISYDVGSSDSASDVPWRLVAGAHTEPPESAAALTVQDPTASGDGGLDFTEKRHTVRATADDEGQIFVTIGVWGTSTDSRTYYLDNVRLLFTRVSLGE